MFGGETDTSPTRVKNQNSPRFRCGARCVVREGDALNSWGCVQGRSVSADYEEPKFRPLAHGTNGETARVVLVMTCPHLHVIECRSLFYTKWDEPPRKFNILLRPPLFESSQSAKEGDCVARPSVLCKFGSQAALPIACCGEPSSEGFNTFLRTPFEAIFIGDTCSLDK